MIAVVGGGVAGLVAARTLALQGHDVEVFEAADATGGMVAAIDVGGARIDAGAEAYATRNPAVGALCAELGLEVAPPSEAPHVWWSDRGIHRLANGIAGIPASWEDPAWKVLQPSEFEQARADLRLPVTASSGDTLGGLVRERLGDAALHYVVAPVVRGVYGTDPDAMPLERVAPGLPAAMGREGSLVAAVGSLKAGKPAVEQPVGGMFQLVVALERELGDLGVQVHRGRPVTAVERLEAGWRLSTHQGDLTCPTWVSAIPRDALAVLLGPLGVDLPDAPAAAAKNILLALNHPGLAERPVGSGIVMGEPTPGITARALTHYTAKWGWAGGGEAEIVRVSWPADLASDPAVEIADVARLTGVELDAGCVVERREVVWDAMPRPLTSAAREQVAAIADELGIAVVGAWYAGNGLAAVISGAREVRG